MTVGEYKLDPQTQLAILAEAEINAKDENGDAVAARPVAPNNTAALTGTPAKTLSDIVAAIVAAAAGTQKVEGVAGGEAVGVSLPGAQRTLLASTVIAANGTTVGTAVTGLDAYTMLTKLLTIADKAMAGAATVNIYLQYSPDGGTTWDDLWSSAQITAAALPNGKRVAFLNSPSGSTTGGRAVTDGTLAAGTFNNVSWCDRVRVKVVAANFAAGDTVTLGISGYFQ